MFLDDDKILPKDFVSRYVSILKQLKKLLKN